MTKRQHIESVRVSPVGLAGLEQVRAIVREHQARKVNEVLIDAFSASAFVAVCDHLNEENRGRLLAMPIGAAMRIAMKLCA